MVGGNNVIDTVSAVGYGAVAIHGRDLNIAVGKVPTRIVIVNEFRQEALRKVRPRSQKTLLVVLHDKQHLTSFLADCQKATECIASARLAIAGQISLGSPERALPHHFAGAGWSSRLLAACSLQSCH